MTAIDDAQRWHEKAACRGKGHELFFGPDGERQLEREARETKAKGVCFGCPVRQNCFEYAVQRPENGLWGGVTEDGLRAERRRRMRRVNAA